MMNKILLIVFLIICVFLLNSTKIEDNNQDSFDFTTDLYHGLLYNNDTFHENEAQISIHPYFNSRYTIYDMNEDGVPELLLDSVHLNFTSEDNTWTVLSSCILSVKDNEVYTWYEIGPHSFDLVNSLAFISWYQSNDLSSEIYRYVELGNDGSKKIELIGELHTNNEGEILYKINNEIVSEELWDIEFGPYCLEDSQVTIWVEFDWSNKRWAS